MSFSGKFKLESTANIPEAFKFLGIPDDAINNYLDPKNEAVYYIQEDGEGGFELINKYTLVPAWNASISLKLDEEKELSVPFPCKSTLTKKSNTTLTLRNKLLGRVICKDHVVSTDGMTVEGSIEGTEFKFKYFYKRME